MTRPDASAAALPADPHAQPVADVLAALATDGNGGLSNAEAAARRERFGANDLPEPGRAGWLQVLGRQFASPLVAILAVAAVVSLAVGHVADAITIGAILVLNAVLGFVQEWRAERALAELKAMLEPSCEVVRDGRAQRIAATELVPGDIVVLRNGDRVPADVRLIAATELSTVEAPLTGESLPVDKQVEPVATATPVAERATMAWLGTDVVGGRGRGVVVGTGTRSEFGRIAEMTGAVEREASPLMRRLERLARRLGIATVIVAIVVAVVGVLRGQPLGDMALVAIALAVAVVPEGLPAVVTITLGLGVRAMAARRALLRRLPAAEALGAATIVCTDKTGTLTAARMAVGTVWYGGERHRIEDLDDDAPAAAALRWAALACADDGDDRAAGGPTETAILEAGARLRTGDTPIERVVPFSSDRKAMTVVRRHDGAAWAATKGAAEVLVPRCTAVAGAGAGADADADGSDPLDDTGRERLLAAARTLAEDGHRVIAVARRRLDATPADGDAEAIERDLELVGLLGLVDPPRPEVRQAVAEARTAGVAVVMVTGDAAATARGVAAEVGLDDLEPLPLDELEAMDDAALAARLKCGAIVARATPAHKLRMVQALRAAGEIVAMTGDGTNDAPALKQADIGVAMGQRGTDVARAAADMVLVDDNFASIVGAIDEGRRQADNIRKFVAYLLASNSGEALAVLANVLIGGPLIFLPVQILWMNLITDGVTALALGVDPAREDVMRRPPRSPREPILDRAHLLYVALLGGMLGILAVGFFYGALFLGADAATARSLAFTLTIVLQEVKALTVRVIDGPMTTIGWFSNPWLWTAILSMTVAQVAAVHWPPLASILHAAPLSLAHWGAVAVAALAMLFIPEAIKTLIARRRASERSAA